MSTETNPVPYPERFAKLVQEAESALTASHRAALALKTNLATWSEILAIVEADGPAPRVLYRIKKRIVEKTTELAEAELLVMDAMERLKGFEEVRAMLGEALNPKPL